MTTRDDFKDLLRSCLQGILSKDLLPGARPVEIAIRHADEALAELDRRYPREGRHTHIEYSQREFARRYEQENGNGRG